MGIVSFEAAVALRNVLGYEPDEPHHLHWRYPNEATPHRLDCDEFGAVRMVTSDWYAAPDHLTALDWIEAHYGYIWGRHDARLAAEGPPRIVYSAVIGNSLIRNGWGDGLFGDPDTLIEIIARYHSAMPAVPVQP